MSKSTFRLVIVTVVLFLIVGILFSLMPEEEHKHDIRQTILRDNTYGCTYHYYNKCKTCDYFVFDSTVYYHEYVDGICLFCNAKNTNTDCLHPNAWGFGGDSLSDSCMSYSYEWYCPDCREYGGYVEYCDMEDEGGCGCDPCECTIKECVCKENEK